MTQKEPSVAQIQNRNKEPLPATESRSTSASELEVELVPVRNSSTLATTLLLVASMAGVGILGLPHTMAAMGWSGALFILLYGALACFTTRVFLLKLFIVSGFDAARYAPSEIYDYSRLGEAAFGERGALLTHLTQNITLGGSTVIYLIVSGLMLHTLIPHAPSKFFTLLVGLLLGIASNISLNMTDMYGNAVLASVTTCVVALTIVSGSLIAYPSAAASTEFLTDSSALSSFAVFAYAFGGHSLHPSAYASGSGRASWRTATKYAYPIVTLGFYLPAALISYLSIGNALRQQDTIFDSFLLVFNGRYQWLVVLGTVSMLFHMIMVLPIISMPVVDRLEYTVFSFSALGVPYAPRKHSTVAWHRLAARFVIIMLFTALAIAMPYFVELMAIVGSVSVTCDVLVFPAVFYLRLVPDAKWHYTALFTAVFGVLTAIASLCIAVPAFVEKINDGGNPFENIFSFGENAV